MVTKQQILSAATCIGFDICGIASAHSLDADRRYAEWWLSKEMDGGLGYLHRNIEKRFSPSLLFEGAKSVIVCGLSYRNRFSMGYPNSFTGKRIASYALSQDYHSVIGTMLHSLAQMLGISEYKATVDTAPMSEKRWAMEAGLGRIGRNRLLITPQFGTFVMLGTLLIREEADSYCEPLSGSPCGECRRCQESCPSGALSDSGIDARLCISRLTIERNADTDADTHCWRWGCDICQSCCPYNMRPSIQGNLPKILTPLFDPTTISESDLAEIIPRTAMARK